MYVILVSKKKNQLNFQISWMSKLREENINDGFQILANKKIHERVHDIKGGVSTFKTCRMNSANGSIMLLGSSFQLHTFHMLSYLISRLFSL